MTIHKQVSREGVQMTSADRLRLEESALQYAKALHDAMSRYARSGKMQVLERGYTRYVITRGSGVGPFANDRTAQHYVFGTCSIDQEYRYKKEWDVIDRIVTFTKKLETIEPGRQKVLAIAKEYSAANPQQATQFVEQIPGRILQPSGELLALPRVKTIVHLLTSVFLGEPTTWRLEAEINGAWPEGSSAMLAPCATMRQVWSVAYRDDVDAVEKRFGWIWQSVPDAGISITGSGTSSVAIDRQLRNLVRVLTLLGPNQVRLLRYDRSQLGTRVLEPAMARPEHLDHSSRTYCIRRSKVAAARGFIQRISPLLDGSSGDAGEGSMQKIGVSTLDLYDEGLSNHPDPVGGIAFKVVSLESMLLTDGEAAEVSYKLRNRVGAMLAMLEGLDGAQVVADLKTAYDIRSGFFHGHVTGKDRDAATPELADRLGDYCRIVIAVFLQSGRMNRRAFLHDLDAGMVDIRLRTALQKKFKRQRISFPLRAGECVLPH